MQELRELLDYYKDIALTDDDLRVLLDGKANILAYRDLPKYGNIDNLLHPYGCAIVLYEWKEKSGHWTCLIKTVCDGKSCIEFFDPYGGPPDLELKFVPEDFKKESGQDHTVLLKMMYDSKYPLSYNEYDFQELKSSIKDCGRWVALRCICKELTLNQFKDLFFNIYSDDLATFLTVPNNELILS